MILLPMSKFTHEGGFIKPQKIENKNNYAAVDRVEVEQEAADRAKWKVYLKSIPAQSNYRQNEGLVYNAKGTNNPNADNYLVVVSVQGPGCYICNGPWPGHQ